jgi:putative endonuclease
MEYSVYIVECADGTLYTGIATDVQRRLLEHNGAQGQGKGRGKGARYTSARSPVRLVYEARCATRSAALKEELRIKRLTRGQKQGLISAARGADAKGA